MRRMNSILLGHQGASGRTDCMYLRMASRVAGSSQDSGRWTMRAATTISSIGGSAASHLISASHHAVASERRLS